MVSSAPNGMILIFTLSALRLSSRSSCPSMTCRGQDSILNAASVKTNSNVLDESYRISWRRIRAWTASSTSVIPKTAATCVMRLRAYADV